MLCLGLCVAHDSGVALVEDGRVHGLVQRERFARRKRCGLITPDFLIDALDRLGTTWADIDVVAISASQSWPYLFVEPDRFRFDYDLSVLDRFRFPFPASTRDAMAKSLERPLGRKRARSLATALADGRVYAEYIEDDLSGFDVDRGTLWCHEWPYHAPWWNRPYKAGDVAEWCAQIERLKDLRLGHLPVKVTLEGIPKPGLIVPHHVGHAAYAFYQSDAETAAVYTLDNGYGYRADTGYTGGIYAYGEGTRLMPIGPTFHVHGNLYQRTAEHLDLGSGTAAGKLMGLAPYGQPRFADRSLIGNAFETVGEAFALGTGARTRSELLSATMSGLLDRISRLSPALYRDPEALLAGADTEARGSRYLRRQAVDIAASAQWIFEQNGLQACRDFAMALTRSNRMVPRLCLGGGGALNCPTNTLLYAQGPFGDIRIPPAPDDSGLPIGAAQALVHDVCGIAREPQGHGSAVTAYRGMSYTRADLDRALAAHGDRFAIDDRLDAATDAGRAVANGAVVGWFEGRSEIGPRALGHRSLLADPRQPANWRRVNDLKRREAWRPFAPAVLEERLNDWFEGSPSSSPHMLFTARVKGDRLPATTHVDRSARVQTVGDDTGGFHRVIKAFDAETGLPVVLNTSLNGPGEPIVETPADALRFLAATEVDAVYIDGVKVTRRGG